MKLKIENLDEGLCIWGMIIGLILIYAGKKGIDHWSMYVLAVIGLGMTFFMIYRQAKVFFAWLKRRKTPHA